MPRRGSRKSKSRRGSKASRKSRSRRGSKRRASRSRSRSRKGKSRRRSKRRSRKASRMLTEQDLLNMMGGAGKAEFIHKLSHTSVKNDKVEVHEEYIVKGDKGLLIKHYHKSGGKVSKLVAKMLDDGSFSVRTIDGAKKDEKDMSKADFLKLLAKDKQLKFAHDYVKSMKAGAARLMARARSRSKSRKSRRSRKSRGSKRRRRASRNKSRRKSKGSKRKGSKRRSRRRRSRK